jgi:hypothetical protein
VLSIDGARRRREGQVTNAADQRQTPFALAPVGSSMPGMSP